MEPDRHPTTHEKARWFETGHLQPDQRQVVMEYARLAQKLIAMLRDGNELFDALDLLVKSKDAAVRQSLVDHGRVS